MDSLPLKNPIEQKIFKEFFSASFSQNVAFICGKMISQIPESLDIDQKKVYFKNCVNKNLELANDYYHKNKSESQGMNS
jgi:hypothetical protein